MAWVTLHNWFRMSDGNMYCMVPDDAIVIPRIPPPPQKDGKEEVFKLSKRGQKKYGVKTRTYTEMICDMFEGEPYNIKFDAPLTLGEFLKNPLSTEIEWCGSTGNPGCVSHFDMGVPFTYLHLDLIEWLKQQPDDVVVKYCCLSHHCWSSHTKTHCLVPEQYRKLIFGGRSVDGPSSEALFARLGRTVPDYFRPVPTIAKSDD